MEALTEEIRARWTSYVAEGHPDRFVEFSLALNALGDHLRRHGLAGLARSCEALEAEAIERTGDASVHPLDALETAALQDRLEALLDAVAGLRTGLQGQRTPHRASGPNVANWVKPRVIWLTAGAARQEMSEAVSRQLKMFGFRVFCLDWHAAGLPQEEPLAVIFIPGGDCASAPELEGIRILRQYCVTSQLLCLTPKLPFEQVVALMRAGIDLTIPAQEQPLMVLDSILNLLQAADPTQYRVLIVEDSRVATRLIQQTLDRQGIDSRAIHEPEKLLKTLESYQADLILMDMHMPRFNGIEATRVLRQTAGYGTIPIVYLSSESDVRMQIEALRLGGDQFLLKPFNPIVLAAVVKTKIERHREIRRSTQIDGLTGLLNHTASKSRLNEIVHNHPAGSSLTVAMIDIDHFKSINDTHGHATGDQVIRGLAWLLKGRLRSTDLIGRYGGEEFIVALPGAGLDQAEMVIDRIRHDFSELPHFNAGKRLHATFSCGIAQWSGSETAAALTKAADMALLQSKRLGRNRLTRSS